MRKENAWNNLEAWKAIENVKSDGPDKKNKKKQNKEDFKDFREGEFYLQKMFYPFV